MKFRPLLAVGLTLACAVLTGADLTITFDAKGKGPMGSGGGGQEIHYYSSTHQLTRNGPMDTLVDFEKGVTFTIDHKKKAITRISFEDAMQALEALDQGQGQVPGLGSFMGALFGDPNQFSVEKLGAETVAGRPCQAYKITVGKLVMALAADPTLKLPVADGPYARMMRARAAQFAKAGPSAASFKRLYEEMAKIKGVPLKTQMSGFMGMEASTVAIKVDQGPIPAGTFELPAYKVEDAGKKLREELAKGR